MAAKRSKQDLLESPPSASSSEGSSSHEDEEESSSEESPPRRQPAARNPHSSPSDSQSDSESESEATLRSATVSELVAKTKPSEPVAIKKARSKAPTPAATKRPAETERVKKEPKKAKQAADGAKAEGTVEKSTPRVWSEEDEISILKGMIEYEEKIGFSPSSDMEAFHAFVKKSLVADASKTQVYEKVRRLKKKYWDNVEKLKKDGTVSSSWKPHDKKIFELSKKIWRGEGNGLQSPKVDKAKSVGKTKKTENIKSGTKPEAPKKKEPAQTPLVDAAKEVQDMEIETNPTPLTSLAENYLLDKKSERGDMERYVLEKGLDLIKGPQRAELEERWANLHKAELQLFVERTKLILDQAKFILAAQK